MGKIDWGPRLQSGFTLVEMLVALLLVSTVMTIIFSTFNSMNRSFSVHEDIGEMQRNMRGAILLLGSELQMAGYDPSGDADARVVAATASSIQFTADLDGDGDISAATSDDEDITYALFTDGGIQKLGRTNLSGNEEIAAHIDNLNLVFLDKDGAVTATLSDIRTVQISIVGKTRNRDPGFRGTLTWENLQGTVSGPIGGDGYRRSVLSVQVKCRNLGL